jgi:peptidoglycan/LPS O-acetylase OafA/YrhL
MAEMSPRIGALLGLIGGTVLLISGLSGISMARMYIYGSSDYPIFIMYITSGTTIAWACIALYGVVKIYRDEEIGKRILLIAGIVGIIATFIPIYFYDTGYDYIQTFYLSSTFIYADLALIIVGGVLSYALTEKKEKER